jgi:hypothetical protein
MPEQQEAVAAIPQDQVAESAPATQPEAKEIPAGQEEQTGAQPKEGDEGAAPKSDQPKGVQKRLDELRRQAGDAQRMNERLLAVLEKTVVHGEPPVTQQPSGPPKREDFASYEEYLEAKADFRIAQQLTVLEQRAVEARRAQAVEQREASWSERQAAAAGKYADYEEVALADDLAITPVMAEAMKDSEIGPDVAYYLGKNPNEALRIARLHPAAQVREIGKIEARIEAKPVRQQSKAPPPIDPIGGSSSGGSGDVSKMSQAEYEAHRRKQGAWWGRK